MDTTTTSVTAPDVLSTKPTTVSKRHAKRPRPPKREPIEQVIIPVPERESFYLFQYRILTFLLFKPFPFVKYEVGTRRVQILKMSHLAIAVGYRSYKLRRAFVELQRLGIIHDVKFAYNKASFHIETLRIR